MTVLPLLLAVLATRAAPGAETGVAVVPLHALPGPTPEVPEAPPRSWTADTLAIRLAPGEESVLSLDVAFQALAPGWADVSVAGCGLTVASATLDGRPAALPCHPDGQRHLVARLSGVHHLRVEGVAATPGATLTLPILPAGRARVEVDAPGLDVDVDGAARTGPGRFDLAAVPALSVRWRPAGAAGCRPRVLTVESAAAFSVGDGEVEGQAVLRFRAVHAPIDAVSFRLPGAPDDVGVEGPGVLTHARAGDRVTVRLAAPVEGPFEVRVRMRAPAAADGRSRPLPLPVPLDAEPLGAWVTVAAADTALVVPEPGQGLEPVATRALPGWATGLAPGIPLAAWRSGGRAYALAARVLDVRPVDAPPTFVDEARYTVAYADHGRLLVRARFQVRNDRNAFLAVAPPPGCAVLGVRVAGRTLEPVRDASGRVLVPLEKSLEGLTGLVAFPVEVTLLGREAAWAPRGRRTLVAPAVDAPVARAVWEVILPPGVRFRGASGAAEEVRDDDVHDGTLAYGRGVARGERRVLSEEDLGDEDRDCEAARRCRSDGDRLSSDLSVEVFSRAYRAYQENAFGEAGALLDEALTLDPDNAPAQALRGNVQVLTGADDEADAAQARRLKDLAAARAVDDRLEQRRQERAAEEALRAGDLDAAEAALTGVAETGHRLAAVEQKESVEQEVVLEEAGRALEVVAKKKAERDEGRAGSKRPSDASPVSAPGRSTASATPAKVAVAPPAASPAPRDAVAAANLVVPVPEAGERVTFEQHLLPPEEPLAVEIRYRTRRTP